MKSFLLALLLSNVAFLVICMPLALIHEAFGSRWAFGALIPISLLVATAFGAALNALGLLKSPALVGLPLVLALLGVIAMVPLIRAFSYTVDSTGAEFKSGSFQSGYIYMAEQSHCENVDFYSRLRWKLIRKGRIVKDSNERYYAYDAVYRSGHRSNSTGHPAIAYLYFENVSTSQLGPPDLPRVRLWMDYCKKEAQWIQAIRTAGDRRLALAGELWNDPQAGRTVPVYVSSGSPLFERWLWGSLMTILLLINSIPAFAGYMGKERH